MLAIILTFLLTTAAYGVLLWLACRRISRHLEGNEPGIQALTTHILLPLFNRQPDEEREPPTNELETP